MIRMVAWTINHDKCAVNSQLCGFSFNIFFDVDYQLISTSVLITIQHFHPKGNISFLLPFCRQAFTLKSISAWSSKTVMNAAQSHTVMILFSYKEMLRWAYEKLGEMGGRNNVPCIRRVDAHNNSNLVIHVRAPDSLSFGMPQADSPETPPPLSSCCPYSLASGTVVRSSLTAGPQPARVQHRR